MLVGVVNGVITVRFRVPSLITTVGTLFFVQGIVVSIYNSQPIMTPVEEPFNEFFGESLYNPRADALLSWHSLSAFSPVLWAILVVAVMSVVLNRTTFGLHTIATGSNPIGAREIGVRTDRIKVYNFMIAGGLAGFAGIINTLQFSSADPAAGAGFLNLEAIAAAVIGGTSLLGGSGTVVGALIGAFVVVHAQQWPGDDRRPGHGVRYLPGRGDSRSHDAECPGRPAPHTETHMNPQDIAPLGADAPIILEMRHISKSFGAVTALVDASITLHRGEVLALVGDNGAGKSTLIKILSGFHQPDGGAIILNGKEVHFASPREARANGIETVYQDLALIGDLSIFHNMFLGREYHKRILRIEFAG